MAGLEEKHYDGDSVQEEQNRKQYLEKDDFGDRCMGCQYLWKELKDKTDACSDCIFNVITNIS